MSETTNTGNNNNANQGDSSDTRLNNGRVYQRRIRTFEHPEERRPQYGTENRSNNSAEFNTWSPFLEPDTRSLFLDPITESPFLDSEPNPFLEFSTQGNPEPEESPIRRQPLPSREEIQASIKQGAIEFRAEYEQKYGKKEKPQVQAKPLAVSGPDDPLEKEADRLADTVLRMEALPEDEVQREVVPEDEEVQREAMPEEDEEVQREALPEEEELQREAMPEDEEIARQPAPRPVPQVKTAETALYRALAELSKTPEQSATAPSDPGYVARMPGSNGTRRVNGKVIGERQQNLIQLPVSADGIQRAVTRDARGIKIIERHPPGRDGVARQKVYRMTVAEAARAGALGQSEEPLQRANDGELKTSGDTAVRIESKRGGGETLGANEREFFETRMDADFSGVRIHRDAEAASLAKDVNAKAFTIGGDVFFGAGQYQPGSSAGKRLIAHELTHTVQQGAADRVAREPEGASKHGGPAVESKDKKATDPRNAPEQIPENDPTISVYGIVEKIKSLKNKRIPPTANSQKYLLPWVAHLDNEIGPENTPTFMDHFVRTRGAIADIQMSIAWRELWPIMEVRWVFQGDEAFNSVDRLKMDQDLVILDAIAETQGNPAALAGVLLAIDEGKLAGQLKVELTAHFVASLLIFTGAGTAKGGPRGKPTGSSGARSSVNPLGKTTSNDFLLKPGRLQEKFLAWRSYKVNNPKASLGEWSQAYDKKMAQMARQLTKGPVSKIPNSYFNPANVIDMRNAPPSSDLTALGHPRNGPWFFRQLKRLHPEMFDKANELRISGGRAPIINANWVKHNPQHQSYLGESLIHHHIEQGPFAVPLPESVHIRWTKILHPITRVKK